MTLFPIVTDVKVVDPPNKLTATLLSTEKEVTAVFANAPIPILVTLFGMFIEVKLLQPKNAKAPIPVTLLGIMLFFVPEINTLFEFLMRLFPSLLK